MSNMWMVRAGRDAYYFEEFKKNKIIAIGWNRLGDLSSITGLEEIKESMISQYPEYSQGQLNISAGMLSRFRFDFKSDDMVVTYNPNDRTYLVGKNLGGYEYTTKKGDFHNTRSVEWIGEVGRDKLSTTTKNTLGAISTLFKLSSDAKDEILQLLEGKRISPEQDQSKEAELETIKEDMQERALEFIKDKISSLDWEEMQELAAGLLRAMGYKTMVSQKGPDRGRDIQASPDGLGLEEPRIIVEVKHRSGQMGANEIRSFTGGLRHGNKGLYLSIGGFTKEAKYEADRSNVPITLIDLDILTKLITQYYDDLDTDAKALIPLTKIYWPA